MERGEKKCEVRQRSDQSGQNLSTSQKSTSEVYHQQEACIALIAHKISGVIEMRSANIKIVSFYFSQV